jgi:hypothetical protein
VRAALSAARCVGLAICLAGFAPSPAICASPTEDDVAIAQNLAEMLRDARTVISDQQELINNAQLGDKHLTGEVVLDQAIAKYEKDTNRRDGPRPSLRRIDHSADKDRRRRHPGS